MSSGRLFAPTATEEMKIFLSTQIADEARHVRFFDRFYSEVEVLESRTLGSRLEETSAHLNPAFGELFDGMLGSRTRHLAEDPSDTVTLVETITLYHMIIEGMLALPDSTSSSTTTSARGAAGFVEGFS